MKEMNLEKLTALMRSESLFKSMDDDLFDEQIKSYMARLGISKSRKNKSVGIGDAGEVPNSLLAEQDLEGSTIKTFKDKWADMNKRVDLYLWRQGGEFGGQEVVVPDEEKAQTEKADLMSFSVWYQDDEGNKKCQVFGNLIEAEAFGRIVQTIGFKNVEITKSAENEGKSTEENPAEGDLLQNIKNAQIKRQKATITLRSKEMTKSFKEFWKEKAQDNSDVEKYTTVQMMSCNICGRLVKDDISDMHLHFAKYHSGMISTPMHGGRAEVLIRYLRNWFTPSGTASYAGKSMEKATELTAEAEKKWARMNRQQRVALLRQTGSHQDDWELTLSQMGGSQQDALEDALTR